MAPIDEDTLNDRTAGGTVPVNFSLGGDFGLGVLAAGYPKSVQVSRSTRAVIGTANATTGRD